MNWKRYLIRIFGPAVPWNRNWKMKEDPRISGSRLKVVKTLYDWREHNDFLIGYRELPSPEFPYRGYGQFALFIIAYKSRSKNQIVIRHHYNRLDQKSEREMLTMIRAIKNPKNMALCVGIEWATPILEAYFKKS